jgi:hypothetical protein
MVMTAFILSGALAFALYELLAFAHWPQYGRNLSYRGVEIDFRPSAHRFALHLVRAAIVIAILICILLIHQLVSPFDAISKHKSNIIFGFLFGALLAIWVNSVVLHSPWKDLTRGQIVAACGLALLFLIGSIGNEAAAVIGQYARHLSSLKFGGTELSFATASRTDREHPGSLPIAGTNQTTALGGAHGLQYLTELAYVIRRDEDYLTTLFATDDPELTKELDQVYTFAKDHIVPPMSCLYGWFQQTADTHAVNGHLAAFVSSFRHVATLSSESQNGKELAGRLTTLSAELERNNLRMAVDILASTPQATDSSPTLQAHVPHECNDWLKPYCNTTAGDQPQVGCVQSALNRIDMPRDRLNTEKSFSAANMDYPDKEINGLIQGLQAFIAENGVQNRPYFSIAVASMMAQLGEYEGAASVLNDWLDQQRRRNATDEMQKEFEKNTNLKIKQDWFALRARSILAAYVEEWLEKKGSSVPTIVQDKHLENLKAIGDAFKSRLLRADFFKTLDDACGRQCKPVFVQPGECGSDEPSKKLELWRKLYTSYVSVQATYVERALKHPDYETKFTDTANDDAQRLVSLDMSCGVERPSGEAVYAQSLLVFAKNALAYSQARAAQEDDATRAERYRLAERALHFGFLLIDSIADEAQERKGRRYLDQIQPTFATSLREQIKAELKQIEQAKQAAAE